MRLIRTLLFTVVIAGNVALQAAATVGQTNSMTPPFLTTASWGVNLCHETTDCHNERLVIRFEPVAGGELCSGCSFSGEHSDVGPVNGRSVV